MMLGNIDPAQIGQGVLGLFIVIGVVAQRIDLRRTTKQVAVKAETVAADVAEKVEATRATTERQIQDIHVMVDGRLDAALTQIRSLETRLDKAQGNPPGTAAHASGPSVLAAEDHPAFKSAATEAKEKT